MPLKAVGTYRKDCRSAAGRIYIPAALVRDSQFPLREGKVEIRIDGDRLVIRQAPDAISTPKTNKDSYET